jgi:hypothetical protein
VARPSPIIAGTDSKRGGRGPATGRLVGTNQLPTNSAAPNHPPDAGVPLPELAAQVVEELVPLDDERREEYALWLGLAEWERGHETAGGSPMWESQRTLSRDVVAALAGRPRPGTFDQRIGVPDPDLLIEAWAEYLHVFTDGIASQAMLCRTRCPPIGRARSCGRSSPRSPAGCVSPRTDPRRV